MIQKKFPEEFKFQPNEYPLEPGIRLIEASAGTGKTFALTHMVLRLLTEKEQSIKEIVVVTFTEAAASELKSRITNRIVTALENLKSLSTGNKIKVTDKVLENWLLNIYPNVSKLHHYASLLAIALEEIDWADITTIHGFCKRTLNRDALENTSSFNPLIEGENNSMIIDVVHEYWRKHIVELEKGDLKGLKSAGINIDTICRLLSTIDNNSTISFNIDENLNDWNNFPDKFSKVFNNYWFDFHSAWEDEGIELESRLRHLAEDYRSQGIKDTKPFSPKPTKNRHEIITKWIQSIESKFAISRNASKPSYDDIRRQSILGNYYHPSIYFGLEGKYKQINITPIKLKLQTAIAKLWDGPAEFVLKHALSWTSNILIERRKNRGVMNYGELLTALDPDLILTNNHSEISNDKTVLFKTLKQRYKTALIDEFQDTDPVQWRILKKAFGESSNHLLLMVGDPKQAIYSFRGGDLNTYLQARQEVDRIDKLLDNFRATAPLMRSLNLLLSSGLKRSNLKVEPLVALSEEKPLVLNNEQHSLKLLTLDLAESTNKTEKLISKSEFEKFIPTVVTNAVVEVLETHPNEIRPEDICILVGRHEQATKISKDLINVGIPSTLVNQGDILKSEASQVLQRFLDCLANPADIRNLKLVACSALMQWDLEKINDSEKNGELDELSMRFRHWSKKLERQNLISCLSELLGSQIIADLSKRGKLLSDLQQCTQLVEEAIYLEGLDAIGASRWLKRQRLHPIEQIPDERQPNSDIAESAINIVTIHHSKGLEYKVVICPYLWQAPPTPNGPLWRVENNQRWLIAVNSGWGEGREAALSTYEESLKEAERLLYVAVTRACAQLILIWANAANQEANPLNTFLFDPESIKKGINTLSTNLINEWLNKKNVPISISPAQFKKSSTSWKPPSPEGALSLGPIPKRILDRSWGRNSYSGWIKSANKMNEINYSYKLDSLEEDYKIEEDNNESRKTTKNEIKYSSSNLSINEGYWSNQGPLSQFPRGTTAGNCLHRILEKLEFTKELTDPHSRKVIEAELLKSGIKATLKDSVEEGLKRVLNTPLGGPLGNLKLKQLHSKRKISELNFEMPIAQHGNPLHSSDISRAFKKNPYSRFSSSYSEELASLNIHSRGFLTGSIDLVFMDNEDALTARWWVTDWKSNWIGSNDSEGGIATCGPAHYNEKAMEEQMLIHHYPLQAHLYLVALHRFLNWRLPNYSPKQHLGGYIYVFLRGLPSAKAISGNKYAKNIPGLVIETAPIDRVIELDKLFEQGGK